LIFNLYIFAKYAKWVPIEGYMYYYGKGVVEERRKAWYLINMAARAGQPDAVIAVAANGQNFQYFTSAYTW
jgi:hypothetical protein